MDGDLASLAAEMMPYMSAAISAYGAAVLTKARDGAADATVEVGRRLLQKVFAPRHEGEPLPGPLAASASGPGDGDALSDVWLAACQALAADPALATEVRSILASAPRVTQQATAGRDAHIVSNHSTTINHYGPYVASPDRNTAGEAISDASVFPQVTIEAPRSRSGANHARRAAATTMASALGGLRLRHRALVISAILAISITMTVLVAQPGHNRGVAEDHNAAPSPALRAMLSDPGNYHVVGSVAFSPNGKTLAVGDVNGATYIWKPASRVITTTLTDPKSEGVDSVAFSPDGKTLAVGDDNGQIYLWNLATDMIIAHLIDSKSGSAYSVAFSPNGRTLAAGYRNGIACLWNLATRRIAARLQEPSGSYAQSVVFSPNGRTLAVGDNNGTTYLWNVTTHKSTPFTADTSTDARSVAFSPNGSTLAVGDNNGTTYLWNLDTRTDPAILTDPKSKGVRSVEFSPNGSTLAVGDSNGTTYLWNLATHQNALLTGTHGLPVDSVAFIPDGTALATGDYDGTTYLWHLPAYRITRTQPQQ
jgi:hypothetical protein